MICSVKICSHINIINKLNSYRIINNGQTVVSRNRPSSIKPLSPTKRNDRCITVGIPNNTHCAKFVTIYRRYTKIRSQMKFNIIARQCK